MEWLGTGIVEARSLISSLKAAENKDLRRLSSTARRMSIDEKRI